jgi:hypothetical protein
MQRAFSILHKEEWFKAAGGRYRDALNDGYMTCCESPLGLSSLIEEAREILAKAKERCKPKLTLAMFSGGNDSTLSTLLCKVSPIGLKSYLSYPLYRFRCLRLPLLLQGESHWDSKIP